MFILLLSPATVAPVGSRADQHSDRETAAPPAEESRLSTALFREGLKLRGLTELLELHMKDFPPANPTEVLLMTREVKLAAFADPARPVGERRDAIAEANRILEQLVEDNPREPRRFEWLYTLGYSLLYEEARPYSTNIVYTGGNDEDRDRLTDLAGRAVAAAQSLVNGLADEYERIDRLSIEEFEDIEGTGCLEELDRLSPNADYLLVWALFYDCLPRRPDDPLVAQQLNEVLVTLSLKPVILETPQEQSHVQVPALLLAGMTHRRLNDHRAARESFDRARFVAGRLTDPTEQERVRWAVALIEIESARNDCDEMRWDAAAKAIERLRQQAGESSVQAPSADRRSVGPVVDGFGLRLVAALLERSLYRARAAEEEAGQAEEALVHRTQAWQALAKLALDEPDRRQELYATLYRSMGPDADAERLDPIEQAALIAGLLSDADSAVDNADELIDRATATGELFLRNLSEDTKTLAPEVLRQLGVAQYRRGDLVSAAGRFLEIARDYRSATGSVEAAKIAVQLGAELNADPANRGRTEVRHLYLNALGVLLTDYADTEAARYWRFFYAQLLEELGDYDAAASEYALVEAGHEQYLESAFLRLRCLARALERRAAEKTSDDVLDLKVRADSVLSAHRSLAALGTAELGRNPDADRTSRINLLLAEGRLLIAETAILPGVERYSQAITNLSDFEAHYPGARALAGRVWRVRLIAYEALGQLGDATQAIPAYVDADPGGAGRTLQSLYEATAADVDKLRAEGDETGGQRKAEAALVLAEQLDRWAQSYPEVASPSARRALTVQLAEAELSAGRYAAACELFERNLPADDGVSLPAAFIDLRILYGHAESLMRLEEFDRALPTFNRLATGLSASLEIRWRSLLGDLRCRTALGHAPEGIIKVIEQQKYLYPEMGGPDLAAQFDRILRENLLRAEEH